LLAPDVVLMDIHLPRNSGINCIKELKPFCPKTEFVIYSIFEDAENIFRALEAGASGYLVNSHRQ
jgi:DNA-binding NarL/FixJ family response regulator